MKKYFMIMPLLILIGFIFYDAYLYTMPRYLRGADLIGTFAPFSVFVSVFIIVFVILVLAYLGFKGFIDE